MAELQKSSSELTTGLLLNKNLFEEDFGYGCVMWLTLEALAMVRMVQDGISKNPTVKEATGAVQDSSSSWVSSPGRQSDGERSNATRG